MALLEATRWNPSKIIDFADSDHNQKLFAGEFKLIVPRIFHEYIDSFYQRHRITRAGATNENYFTKAELNEMFFRDLDSNKNGKLEKAEFEQNMRAYAYNFYQSQVANNVTNYFMLDWTRYKTMDLAQWNKLTTTDGYSSINFREILSVDKVFRGLE